jgi:hypothetical protein
VEVRNIHERFIPAPAQRVGPLIDGLGSPSDRLWPHDRWPAMRLDRDLAVGARGGHGPIRYTVERYEPGRMVRFRFSAPRGFQGTHVFHVEDGQNGALLRHELEMHATGLARLSWPLVFGPLHDALIEDALDRAMLAFCREPPPRHWPTRVRVLRALLRRRRRPTSGRQGARR